MKTHNLRVKAWILPNIRNGSKAIEVRLLAGEVTRIKPGDQIVFNGDCHSNVGRIRHYPTLEDLVDAEGANAIYPGSSPEPVLQGLHYLYRFSDHGFGFVAIEITPQA